MRKGNGFTPKSIMVKEYKVSDCRERLSEFGSVQYHYKDKPLFMRCEQMRGQARGCPFFGSAARKGCQSSDIVELSPSICSSFAIWPRKKVEGRINDLMDACPDEFLRPQFVFLALNWSARIGDFYANGNQPNTYFRNAARWSNFHSSLLNTRRGHSRLEAAFAEQNPFRGGYLTDFVKGLVDSNGNNAYRFLAKEEAPGFEEPPFVVFIEVLKKELAALEKGFAIPDAVPKYLIFFGPTIFNRLQALSLRFLRKPLEAVFADRTILRTGAFYRGVYGLTRDENIQQLREIYLPSGAGPYDVSCFIIQRTYE